MLCGKLFQAALSACSVGIATAEAGEEDDEKCHRSGADLDMKFLEAFSFAAVRGKRFAAASQTVGDPAIVAAMVSCSLVLEPLCHIQSWLLRITLPKSTSSRSEVFDLWHDSTSPLKHGLQHSDRMHR